MRIILSGGGTSGHINPALAVADALRLRDGSTELLFVGAIGRPEMERVPQAGYAIEGLDIAGFQRNSLNKNLGLPLKLAKSLLQSREILKKFRPDMAIGFGGYASGPLLFVAGWMGIPTIIQEQNSHAGVTNRLLSRKARAICVAYPEMNEQFRSRRIIFTGNPVRQGLDQLGGLKAEALRFYGLNPSLPTLLVTGGSLGARTLNEAVAQHTQTLQAGQVQVLWQTGKRDFDQYSKLVTSSPLLRIFPYLERMDYAFAAADAVVARAGALTISELCVVGKPALLVPSPNVAEDHQTRNAQSLVKQQAALMIADSEAIETVIPKAISLLKDAAMRSSLSQTIKTLAPRIPATEQILAVIYAVKEGVTDFRHLNPKP